MAFNKNNNNNKGNNNRNNYNYFSQEIQRNGANFLDRKSASDIQKDAPNIFRQLSRGKIDISQNIEYFRNEYFLQNCIDVAQTKFNYHSVSRLGIQTLMNVRANDPSYTQMEYDLYNAVFSEHQACEIAHKIILDHLTIFKNTEDQNSLLIMVGLLTQYRNVL